MQLAEQQQLDQLERRGEARKKALMHAFVSDFDGYLDLKCIIRDISRSGCRIATSYVEDLPRHIRIIPEGFKKPLIGKIVWRNAKFAGVKFVTGDEADALNEPDTEQTEPQPRQGFFSKLFSFSALRRRSGHARAGDERTQPALPTYGARALNAVRQPIAAIKNLLGLLMSGSIRPIPRKAQSIIKAAQGNARHAEKLLSDALRADNIESGRIKCRIGPVEVAELVSDASLMSAGFAAEYNVRLEVLDSVKSARVEADPARLTEVIQNLVVAAAKASSAESRISIKLDRMGRTIRISVCAACENADWCNEEPDSEGSDSEDLRLELDVVRAILEQHKTLLSCAKSEGRGSCAWFELAELVLPD